ncbi:inactive serine/threonine-protein kinase VRK3 isoform X3 [Anguilla rostrata]|uniref:inactive serine/threonine-protein kinase VRK3 isoform X3 n=1 Tax=Anguilla rostrata TaxID=7938 RepID=UPI0030D48C5E
MKVFMEISYSEGQFALFMLYFTLKRQEACSVGMPLNFCPECGFKLLTNFKFCPSCGQKLPFLLDTAQVDSSTSSPAAPQTSVTDGSVAAQLQSSPWPTQAELIQHTGDGPASSVSGLPRSPLRRTQKLVKVTESASPLLASATPLLAASPKSAAAAKNKSKRMKRASPPKPLEEGEQVTDTAGVQWKLVKLLSQSDTEIFYGVQQVTTRACSADYEHILKLASKDGKIFNEQNFLQRAAKPTSVKKWKKDKQMDFLGLPSCDGFGLHADSYRFLILPNMGQTLQSFMLEGEVLSEKAVLQLSCRILDVLEYIHENEYVHADIHAENIYIDFTKPSQVYLAGYCHAFRYCPSGKHVEYREGSRTPHEGAVEFISVDSHKGAGPSRRSDLQALGYCMLSWLAGALPWTSLTDCPAKVMAEKERYMTDVQGLRTQCFGRKKMAGAVQVYLSQVMSLQYTEKPDYQQLHSGLLGALHKLGASLDQPIDLQV